MMIDDLICSDKDIVSIVSKMRSSSKGDARNKIAILSNYNEEYFSNLLKFFLQMMVMI